MGGRAGGAAFDAPADGSGEIADGDESAGVRRKLDRPESKPRDPGGDVSLRRFAQADLPARDVEQAIQSVRELEEGFLRLPVEADQSEEETLRHVEPDVCIFGRSDRDVFVDAEDRVRCVIFFVNVDENVRLVHVPPPGERSASNISLNQGFVQVDVSVFEHLTPFFSSDSDGDRSFHLGRVYEEKSAGLYSQRRIRGELLMRYHAHSKRAQKHGRDRSAERVCGSSIGIPHQEEVLRDKPLAAHELSGVRAGALQGSASPSRSRVSGARWDGLRGVPRAHLGRHPSIGARHDSCEIHLRLSHAEPRERRRDSEAPHGLLGVLAQGFVARAALLLGAHVARCSKKRHLRGSDAGDGSLHRDARPEDQDSVERG